MMTVRALASLLSIYLETTLMYMLSCCLAISTCIRKAIHNQRLGNSDALQHTALTFRPSHRSIGTVPYPVPFLFLPLLGFIMSCPVEEMILIGYLVRALRIEFPERNPKS
ncbi:hypothetical protein BO99DRAFT_50826 [Aspergillus violaceofuscus CBS 115571]|uniref:Uncharacterized protein n=1 Tax=Aspergillus violaceofuscus (strain CBS 115571) TaxID=1450538 RepID=A0A2V5GRE7_ASPV1|nr:hypothetical protein BO99DRAFT_50826 [Aspergillus violaceofuscus CBS 115571]